MIAPGPGIQPASSQDELYRRFEREWRTASLEFTEQQRFDLAERLSALIYPKYRFSEFARTYFDDRQFLDFYVTFVATDNFHSYDRKYLQKELLKLIDRVPGDTAECGVYEGAGSWLICRHTADQKRLHHLFDSFEGLSAPGAHDGTYWAKGAMAVPEERVRQRLAEFANVRFWRGWIPERFADVADRRFAFVHVDVDLYQPTADSVGFFYPRINPGGILLFDDYGFSTCPGARRAIDEYFATRPEQVVDLPTGQAIVIVGT